MKEIKVFLASSEEMKDDRLLFGDFIRKLNELFNKREKKIVLLEWEDLDASYNGVRKQNEYNEHVRQSDIFIALFRTKAGKYTQEELNVAIENFKENQTPKIYIFISKLKDNENEDESLTKYIKYLKCELEYFPINYSNKDEFHLHFLLQLLIYENKKETNIKVEGDKLTFEGIEIGKVDEIDFFAKNEDFIRIREDLQGLNEDIIKLRQKIEKYSDDEDFKIELQEKLDKRNALQKEFDEHQIEILDFEKHIISLQGKRINDIEARAMELFSEGKLKEARIILKESRHEDEKIEKEWYATKEKIGAIKENMEQIISKSITDAKLVVLDTTISIEERKEEAKKVYSDADRRAKEIDLEKEKYIKLLGNYGEFLTKYAYYEEAINIYERLISLCEEDYEQNCVTANSYNNIGLVYYNLGYYEKALKYYNKAIEIHKTVLDKNHPFIAISYNNIGNVYRMLGDNNKALMYYNEALNIQEASIEKNNHNVANSYNNIGTVYADLKNYNKALKFHKKALEIFEAILGENHPDTSTSYNNIGVVYADLENYNKALKFHKKALEIRKQVLGEIHSNTATSYNNIGVVYADLGKYNEALEYLNKALEIFKEVLGENHTNTTRGILQDIESIKQNMNHPKNKKGFFARLFGKD